MDSTPVRGIAVWQWGNTGIANDHGVYENGHVASETAKPPASWATNQGGVETETECLCGLGVIEEVEQQIEGFEREGDAGQVSRGQEELARIVVLRRTLATLRRSLVLHRETYARLSDPHLTSLASEDSANRARDLLARLERAVDAAESARQMVTGSFEILMTRSSQRTNETMKLLTLISAALLPSAVIAGVLGMNFKQAFFDLSYLFWVVVALMVALTLTVGLVARWRNWL